MNEVIRAIYEDLRTKRDRAQMLADKCAESGDTAKTMEYRMMSLAYDDSMPVVKCWGIDRG